MNRDDFGGTDRGPSSTADPPYPRVYRYTAGKCSLLYLFAAILTALGACALQAARMRAAPTIAMPPA